MTPHRPAIFGALAGLVLLASCNTNPPPRPLPSPAPAGDRTARDDAAIAQKSDQPGDQTTGEPSTPTRAESTDQSTAQSTPQPSPQSPPQPAQATGPDAPAWYRPGVQTIDGRAHRAFAVSAADVRDARNRAMQLAYEAYPDGDVAAHEAQRLPDGGWRFYVLIAASG